LFVNFFDYQRWRTVIDKAFCQGLPCHNLNSATWLCDNKSLRRTGFCDCVCTSIKSCNADNTAIIGSATVYQSTRQRSNLKLCTRQRLPLLVNFFNYKAWLLDINEVCTGYCVCSNFHTSTCVGHYKTVWCGNLFYSKPSTTQVWNSNHTAYRRYKLTHKLTVLTAYFKSST
jgi:hypothetical protein